ncbi:hypothetical protein [Dyella sp. C11]|uniref:hypothetical protein n=1 Tax=Dyella sp. C11 TaxID=2126991 RepID=UPI001300B82F|nr:hypothetical protein [Dyella sp. C11]
MLSLLPIFLTIALVIVPLLFSRARETSNIFSYSRPFKAFSFLACVLPPAVWFLFSYQGVGFDLATFLMALVVDICVILASLNIMIYKVTVGDDSLEIRSFRQLQIEYESIEFAGVRNGGNGSRFLFINYDDGKNYSISSYVQGFDRLAEIVCEKARRPAQIRKTQRKA